MCDTIVQCSDKTPLEVIFRSFGGRVSAYVYSSEYSEAGFTLHMAVLAACLIRAFRFNEDYTAVQLYTK